jgi:L-arabinonolactonase
MARADELLPECEVMQITRVGTLHCRMGEGPLWDVEQQALYLVDVFGKRLWRLDAADGDPTYWDFPERISAIALDNLGGAIVALQTGLHHFDFPSQRLTLIEEITRGDPAIFLNDAKCDARGRFLFGTVDAAGTRDVAALFRLDVDGTVTQLDEGYRITNGPCWSPDGRTFYFADSMAKTIFAYDYDLGTGTVANRRAFADLTDVGGIPDGATVDTQGRLWTAMCDGGKVVCIDSQGSIELTIDFPTCFVSSVMFGGPRLDRLYVTSIAGEVLAQVAAAGGVSAADRAGPLGGALFVVDGLDACGLPAQRYGGRLAR